MSRESLLPVQPIQTIRLGNLQGILARYLAVVTPDGVPVRAGPLIKKWVEEGMMLAIRRLPAKQQMQILGVNPQGKNDAKSQRGTDGGQSKANSGQTRRRASTASA